MIIRSLAGGAVLPRVPVQSRVRYLIAVIAIAAAAQLIAASVSAAQAPTGRNEVFAGSELESYLRYLQSAGKSRDYPWSMRMFSPLEIDSLTATDAAHPWATRYDLQRKPRANGFHWDYVRPRVATYLNTAFAYGGNDGPVWQGKGLTTAVQGGISARWGPFSASIAPIAFRAENQFFPIMANSETGKLRFADGQWAQYIDRPQRFGTGVYSRFDPGQSWVRFDGYGVAAGISTANEWWGPTTTYPYIIGNNAAGFPHIFFGTAMPVNIWIAKLHTRVFYGELDQSSYSTVTGPDYFASFEQPGTKRFMAGLVAILQPRGVPGLEIGGSRFFHAAKDNLGHSFSAYDLKLPFQGFYKVGLPSESDTVILGGRQGIKENQLASVFLRWTPGSGLDFYGEYGREDHSQDKRDLVLLIDHSASLNIGFRKAWVSRDRIRAVRGEAFTYEAAATHLGSEGQTYLHGVLRQGHTERGQMLGANVGPGGGSAQILAFDNFTTKGRLTAFVTREVQHQVRYPIVYTSGPAIQRAVDAITSIGGEAKRFFGPVDVLARASINVDLNRYFIADRANGNFALEVRQSF